MALVEAKVVAVQAVPALLGLLVVVADPLAAEVTLPVVEDVVITPVVEVVVAVEEVEEVVEVVEAVEDTEPLQKSCSSSKIPQSTVQRSRLIRIRQPGGPHVPSAKVKEVEDATVAKKQTMNLSSLSLTTALPRRPGYATLGRPIKLLANYFDILPQPDLQLFRYHIDVVPLPTPMRRRKRAFQLFLEKAPFLSGVYPAAATDYSSTLVSVKKLNLGPQGKTTYEVLYFEPEEAGPREEDPKKFTFQVTYTNTLSVQELMDYLKDVNKAMELPEKASILQVLNIAMARKPNSSPNVASFATRNKFFPVDGQLGELGGGLVALRGYYTSVRTATLRLLLNVNSITAAFYKPGPLFNLMSTFRESLPRGSSFEQRCGKFLKGVRVSVSHLKTENNQLRTKVIAGIEPHGYGANKVQFDWEEKKKKVTVQQYFQERT